MMFTVAYYVEVKSVLICFFFNFEQHCISELFSNLSGYSKFQFICFVIFCANVDHVHKESFANLDFNKNILLLCMCSINSCDPTTKDLNLIRNSTQKQTLYAYLRVLLAEFFFFRLHVQYF